MRLRACMAGLLLGTGACAQMPGLVRIEVDGREIELRQQGFSDGALAGGWSTSPECPEGGSFVPIPRALTGIRSIFLDEIELNLAGGRTVRLYRCPR